LTHRAGNGGRASAADNRCAGFGRDEARGRRLRPQQCGRTNRRLGCGGSRERGACGARDDACERLPDRRPCGSGAAVISGAMRSVMGSCASRARRVEAAWLGQSCRRSRGGGSVQRGAIVRDDRPSTGAAIAWPASR
jgi:hypothetical protein